MPSLGLDPGRTGGAVLLGPQSPDKTYSALWAAWWRPRGSGGLLLDVYGPEEALRRVRAPVASLHAVGCVLRGLTPSGVVLIVEGQHIPTESVVVGRSRRTALRKGANVRSALSLATSAGEVQGPLLCRANAEYRPQFSEWATRFGFRSGAARKANDRHALEKAGPAVLRGLGPLAETIHVVEAGLMAAWGDQMARAQARKVG